jgi:hypothetical protein
MDNYFIWSKHGETQPKTKGIIDEREEENMNADQVYSHHDDGGVDGIGENDEGPDVEEQMRNVVSDVFLLYEECKGCHKEHTVLWMTLELLKLKASNVWLDSSSSALLELLSKVLPKPKSLPTSTYLAKKIIYPLTLGIEKNPCLPEPLHLILKVHEFKDKCPR